jgi:hypothetical protein
MSAGAGAGVVEPSSIANAVNISATSAQSVPYQSVNQGSTSFAKTGSRVALRFLPPKSKDSDNNDSARSVEVTKAQKTDPNSKKPVDPAPTHRDSEVPPQLIEQSQGRNTEARNALISATGREFGPDIALKVGPNIDSVNDPDQYISKIITKDSSITEVLNILAFLLNNEEQRRNSIIQKFSYVNQGRGYLGVTHSIHNSNAPFDITTLTTDQSPWDDGGDGITIPGTILRRDEFYGLKKDIPIEYNQIQPLISACILQMINILENTREVFGGWAKLFKGMQGGSSKSKTKKTRRRH